MNLANSKGVNKALREAREFNEIEMILKRLHKKLKQLEIEGITLEHFPSLTKKLFHEVTEYSHHDLTKFNPDHEQFSDQGFN